MVSLAQIRRLPQFEVFILAFKKERFLAWEKNFDAVCTRFECVFMMFRERFEGS